jgi:hypothetical protein
MSSPESPKSFHGSGQFSKHKLSRLRPKIPASPIGGGIVKDLRRERVWKACERCKIKKIKVRNKTFSDGHSLNPNSAMQEGRASAVKKMV